MKAIIEAISPAGFVTRFEVTADNDDVVRRLLTRLADVEVFLKEAHYSPSGQMLTPDGLPICRKHGAVMRRREKQGDSWFSHVIEVDGKELWCKGRPGKDSPGWDVDEAAR